MIKTKDDKVLIMYTNYKGVTNQRWITPIEMWFGESEFHKGNQWFLKARDDKRKVIRDFALNDLTIL